MKRLTSFLFVVGAAVGGCYAETSGYVVEDAPPVARQEVVVYRPGYVWVHGHWHSDGNHYVWRGGYYERTRPGYTYVEGRHVKHGKRYVWVDGGWHRG